MDCFSTSQRKSQSEESTLLRVLFLAAATAASHSNPLKFHFLSTFLFIMIIHLHPLPLASLPFHKTSSESMDVASPLFFYQSTKKRRRRNRRKRGRVLEGKSVELFIIASVELNKEDGNDEDDAALNFSISSLPTRYLSLYVQDEYFFANNKKQKIIYKKNLSF